MAKPYASDPRRVYKSSPSGVTGVIWVAFGIALLLGLTSGLVWILYNLFL
jgi:hypothetical protein